MEYMYAALLLHKLGKEITDKNMQSVVAAAGVSVDESKVKSLIASLKGVDIDKELASASLITAAPVSSGAKEEKKEEKAPKEDKAPAAEGLSALFG